MKKLALTLVMTGAMGGLLTGGMSVLAAETDSDASVIITDPVGPPPSNASIKYVSPFNFGTIVSSDKVQTKVSENARGNDGLDREGGLIHVENASGTWTLSVKEDSSLLPGGTIAMTPTLSGTPRTYFALSPKTTLNDSYQTLVSATNSMSSEELFNLNTELSIPANTASGEYNSTVTFNLENTI